MAFDREDDLTYPMPRKAEFEPVPQPGTPEFLAWIDRKAVERKAAIAKREEGEREAREELGALVERIFLQAVKDNDTAKFCPRNRADCDRKMYVTALGETAVVQCPHRECLHERARIAYVLERAGVGPRYRQPQVGRIYPELRKAVQAFAESFDEHLREGTLLYLSGPVGIGKSCALTWLLGRVGYAGHSVAYRSAGRLLDDLARRDSEAEERYTTCELLGIDDVGTEYSADWPMARLHELIEERYVNSRPTAVTSNVHWSYLKSLPEWERIIDRWSENAEIYWQNGQSQRRQGE